MFDHIDHIADKIIRERICNFDNSIDGFKRTLPKTRERFKRTDEEIVNSTADDLYFNLNFLKSELDARLLLLNSKGVRLFFDKLKQKLGYQNANQLSADIKLAILEGKEIKPKEKPDIFAYIDASFVLPYYEGVELDFDIEALIPEILTLWLDFLSKANELVTQLETEYLGGNQTKDDDILVLKLTLWGMSLNLNKIWKKYLNSKNGR